MDKRTDFSRIELAKAMAICFSMPHDAAVFMKIPENKLNVLYRNYLLMAKSINGQMELIADHDKLEKVKNSLQQRVSKQQQIINRQDRTIKNLRQQLAAVSK